ncbi:MAG TPA: caspase family protein [Rhodocyclaceae bacterium]|nr:caspase family protein [Rhodocyclaceae bacterium]
MALEAVSGTPGLWRDPQWQPGMPGVYALIIGISAYPHLEDGPAPAPETYGLGQLLSSARTAARMFTWLRTDFRHPDLPVVWSLLLLSPSADERTEFDAAGLTHYDTPDYARLRLGIQRWTAAVPKQPPASTHSRSVFFFSGHGVGANRTPLLLPADYLDPQFGDPQLENCFSARELQRWMTENPVGEHLALLDACRNEFSPLAEKASGAHGAFPVNPPNAPAPRAAATLASTSPDKVAYQFPGQPLTLFGQAVLEALNGGADTGNLRVDFREVVDYVRPRINVLLKAVNTALDQTVWPSSEGEDLIVTELAPPAVAAAGVTGGAPAATRARGGGGALYRSVATPGVASRGPAVAAQMTAAAGAAVDARFDPALQVDDDIPLAALRGSFPQTVRRFGHEYASMIWNDGNVRLHSLKDGGMLDDAARVRSVARDAASSIVQVDLALGPHPHGALLVFDGARDVQRTRLAVALPTDPDSPVPVRLMLTIAPSTPGEPPRLQKLQAWLGPDPGNPHYDYLWSLTREAELGSLRNAAGRADPERLKDAARDKLQYPTAATAGMLLLARAGTLAQVGSWTRNLMQLFPALPDAAVLWAESLRSALASGEAQPFGVAAPLQEMAEALTRLLERRLPLFADALELADSQVRFLRRAPLPDALAARVARVGQWIERIFAATLPGGHFLVVPGLPRPEWLGGGGAALTDDEIIALLRRPPASG